MGQGTNIKNGSPVSSGNSTWWKKIKVEFFEKYTGGESYTAYINQC